MTVSVALDDVSIAFPHRLRAMSLKHWLVGERDHPDRGWTKVLHNVSLSAQPGARMGIVGRKGAGKTTLLKVIAGFFPPLSGTRIASGRIAPVISQGLGFDSNLSIRLNIRLALLHSNR